MDIVKEQAGKIPESDILKRLNRGDVIIGDGSYVITLEKRGYVKGGRFTPEAACEHPDAVKQLGLEFSRAGADVTQTFTYYTTEETRPEGTSVTCSMINQAACRIALEIKNEKQTIVAGGITQSGIYNYKKVHNKELVQKELKNALTVLLENNVDFIILEYFRHIEELEWAIELVRNELGDSKAVAANMCMGPKGDQNSVPVGDCAVRMVRAGADLVGLNCLFDPFICLETLKLMKQSLDSKGLKTFLMAQPLGFKTPDAGPWGWIDIPEYPYAVEPRQITRIEAAKFAREAYDLGVRYIGGCCGFEPYHIRAMAEELAKERGRLPESSTKSDIDFTYIGGMAKERPEFAGKGNKEYWFNLEPSTGRPRSTPLCKQKNPQTVMKSVFM